TYPPNVVSLAFGCTTKTAFRIRNAENKGFSLGVVVADFFRCNDVGLELLAGPRHRETSPQENRMLKTIALAGVFFFVSAISTSAFTNAAPKKPSQTSKPAPTGTTTPQPKGFCFPPGMPC